MSVRLPIFRTLLLVAVIASPAAAQPLQAPLGLDVSLPAAKRLAGARELIAAQNWEAALTTLERLDEDFGAALIEVEPGRFLNVRHTVAATLASLPEPGRIAYRRRHDPAMELLYQEARARHSPAMMRQVVRDGFATSFGDDALDWLAEDALAGGDVDTARRWWMALLPAPAGSPSALLLRYPDARLKPAEISARLVLCTLFEAEPTRAQQEVARFESRFADTRGELAGQSGALAGLLTNLLEESRQWRPLPASTTAGNADREAALDLAVVEWSQPLSPSAADMSHVGATGFTRFTDPSTTPKVWDDVLIVPEMYGVRALSSALGTPRWPSGNDDDNGTLFADPPAPGAAQFPVSPVGGFATQVVHGRCSALIAAPVSLAPETRTSLPPSRLVCLDLNAQGRLAWVASSDEFSEFPDGRFSGPPLMSGASVYVPVRWGEPLNEIGVACFNATTGALRWHQRVCTGFNSGEAPRRPPVLDALAVGAGSVFLLPAEGLVAAVDAETGALQWAVTGPAPQRTEPAVPDGAPELVCHGGRVFARPRDSHQLLALAADDGRQLWSLDPPTRIRDLLGVADGRLIAGGDHLWGIDVATGHAWRFGFDDPEGYGYGRGTIAGGRIYWPTHDELFVVDALAGQLVDRILLSPATGITGGNLTVAGRRLIIAAPNRLSAIGPAAWD